MDGELSVWENQMISSYSSLAIQSNDSYYLRTNVHIVRKDILH